MNEIASVVLSSGIDLDQYDGLRIGITSAFDLGIASGSETSGDAQPLAVWRQRAAPQSN